MAAREGGHVSQREARTEPRARVAVHFPPLPNLTRTRERRDLFCWVSSRDAPPPDGGGHRRKGKAKPARDGPRHVDAWTAGEAGGAAAGCRTSVRPRPSVQRQGQCQTETCGLKFAYIFCFENLIRNICLLFSYLPWEIACVLTTSVLNLNLYVFAVLGMNE